MIPIKLTLEGIYSYKQKTTIDFSRLTESKLFGIFGSTGSGKSTILEAMMYALYGNSERLGKTNFRYDMMNLASNRMYIDFEFYAGNDNTIYRITTESKRNKKNFSDVTTSKRNLYKKNDNDWIPVTIEKDTVEKIIGLSSNNFKRIIIIPQGKFQEFLQLTGNARSEMMMEIFPELKEYDLFDKAKKLLETTKMEIANIDGQLSMLPITSEEELNELKTSIKNLKIKQTEIQNSIKIITEKISILEKIKEKATELTCCRVKYDELIKNSSDISDKEKMIKDYQKCVDTFKADLSLINNLTSTIENDSEALQKLTQHIDNLIITKEELLKRIDAITIEYEKAGQYAEEIKKLELIKNINNIKHQLNTKQTELEQHNTQLSKGEKFVTEITNLINELKKDTAKLTELINKIEVINNITHWFSKHDLLISQLNEKRQQLKSLQDELDEASEKRRQYISEAQKSSEKITNTNDIEEYINSKQKHLSETEKILQELNIKKELENYSQQIEEGKPCPLCGSLHHPEPIQIQNVDRQLEEKSHEKAKISSEITLLNTLFNKLANIEEQINKINDKIITKKAEAEAAEKTVSSHISTFDFKGYSIEDKDRLSHEEKHTKQQIEELKSKQKQLEDTEDKLNRANLKINAISTNIQNVKIEISQLDGQLKICRTNVDETFENEYSTWTDESIDNLIGRKNKGIEETKKAYISLMEEEKALSNRIGETQGKIQASEEKISKDKAQKNSLLQTVNSNLLQTEFKTIEEVNSILKSGIDIANLEKEIEKHKADLAAVKDRIATLEKELSGTTFKEEELQQLNSQYNDYQTIIKENIATTSQQENKLKELSEDREKRNELEKIAENKKTRLSNLNEICSVFTGKGFVKYVSTIYLEDLCRNANERFRRMTNNQLELCINDKSEFELIDYMNEGRHRAVDTLSGGQTFQASLSLALALIDNMRHSSHTTQKFFFLDEGFGSQDKDSLNQIFETLTRIQKEDKIVGIISHVEELQQKIPASITITRDENGSHISKFCY